MGGEYSPRPCARRSLSGCFRPEADTKLTLWCRELSELGKIVGDGEPRCLVRDKDVHAWRDTWVIVQTAKLDAAPPYSAPRYYGAGFDPIDGGRTGDAAEPAMGAGG